MTLEYNCEGKLLTAKDRKLILPGIPLQKDGQPDWNLLAVNSDDDGFDITKIRKNGSYYETVELPKGTRIIRYGIPSGTYTAPYGTLYEQLSLPYEKASMPYHEYIVIKHCLVRKCIVDESYVAPNFHMSGGGVQYHHQQPITQLLKSGVLKEDMSWLRKEK